MENKARMKYILIYNQVYTGKCSSTENEERVKIFDLLCLFVHPSIVRSPPYRLCFLCRSGGCSCLGRDPLLFCAGGISV